MKKRILPFVLLIVILVLCASCSNTAPPTGTANNSAMSSPTTEVTVQPTPEATEPEPAKLYPGEMLCMGIPVSLLFESTADDAVKALGAPLERDDYTCYYDDVKLYFSDGAGEIISVEVSNPGVMTIDGAALNKNRDGLVEILGEPYDESSEEYGYLVRYNQPTYSTSFELAQANEEAWRVYISPVLSESSAKKYAEDWLSYSSFNFDVSLEAEPVDGVDSNEYHTFSLYYSFPDDVGLLTVICVNKRTGEMLSQDPYSGVMEPLDDWYYKFNNPENGDDGGSQSGEPVSADGYIISSGATVYVKGGGWSLMGSLTEGVINFKADGGYSITWVAVLENMGISGWQRSEIYRDGLVTKVYSPTTKQSLLFNSPSDISLSKLYINP